MPHADCDLGNSWSSSNDISLRKSTTVWVSRSALRNKRGEERINSVLSSLCPFSLEEIFTSRSNALFFLHHCWALSMMKTPSAPVYFCCPRVGLSISHRQHHCSGVSEPTNDASEISLKDAQPHFHHSKANEHLNSPSLKMAGEADEKPNPNPNPNCPTQSDPWKMLSNMPLPALLYSSMLLQCIASDHSFAIKRNCILVLLYPLIKKNKTAQTTKLPIKYLQL